MFPDAGSCLVGNKEATKLRVKGLDRANRITGQTQTESMTTEKWSSIRDNAQRVELEMKVNSKGKWFLQVGQELDFQSA